MKSKVFPLVVLVMLLSVVIGACNPTAATPVAQEPPTEEAVAEKPAATEQALPAPKELNIALILNSEVEQPWNLVHIEGVKQLAEAAKADGVTVNYVYSENVWGDDIELAMRQYADEGKYDIIWNAGARPDAIENVMKDYPEIIFIESGSGGTAFGANSLWLYLTDHEPAYIMGIIAGMMTKSNIIGVVGGYPGGEVNSAINAYRAGALSVNPDVKVKVTFIESWWDPPKAKEAAVAQIAAGADLVYAERFGVLEALKEKGLLGFGNYQDENPDYPDVVITSPLIDAGPITKDAYDMWYEHKTTGKPYNGPMDRVYYLWKDGGADLAPFHNFENTLPKEVLDKVAEVKAAILDGSFIVPFDETQPNSD